MKELKLPKRAIDMIDRELSDRERRARRAKELEQARRRRQSRAMPSRQSVGGEVSRGGRVSVEHGGAERMTGDGGNILRTRIGKRTRLDVHYPRPKCPKCGSPWVYVSKTLYRGDDMLSQRMRCSACDERYVMTQD